MDSIDVLNRIANEGSVAILVLIIVLTAYITYYHVENNVLGFIYLAILSSVLAISMIAVGLGHTGQLKDIYYFYRHRRIIITILLIGIATIVYAFVEGSRPAYIISGVASWALFLWGFFNIPRMLEDF
jgi:hypothetical protein